MTIKECAERLSVSSSLIYSLVASRKIRFCRIGNGRGRLRIPEDAVLEYLARCTFDIEEPKSPARSIRPLRHLDLS
jgi:excisionase family DNA binding protein